MIRPSALALVVAGSVATALAAQEPQPSKLDKPSSTMIVTGCLQHADPTATNLGDPKPGFILTDAIAVAPPADSTGAPPATVGTTGAKPDTYALDGNDVELALHAARQVEITGSPVVAPGTDEKSSEALPHAEAAVTRLHVAAIKDMSMDCAPKS